VARALPLLAAPALHHREDVLALVGLSPLERTPVRTPALRAKPSAAFVAFLRIEGDLGGGPRSSLVCGAWRSVRSSAMSGDPPGGAVDLDLAEGQPGATQQLLAVRLQLRKDDREEARRKLFGPISSTKRGIGLVAHKLMKWSRPAVRGAHGSISVLRTEGKSLPGERGGGAA